MNVTSPSRRLSRGRCRGRRRRAVHATTPPTRAHTRSRDVAARLRERAPSTVPTARVLTSPRPGRIRRGSPGRAARCEQHGCCGSPRSRGTGSGSICVSPRSDGTSRQHARAATRSGAIDDWSVDRPELGRSLRRTPKTARTQPPGENSALLGVLVGGRGSRGQGRRSGMPRAQADGESDGVGVGVGTGPNRPGHSITARG